MAISIRWMVPVMEVGRVGIDGTDCGETGLNILCENNSGILWDVILILCKKKPLIIA